MRITQHDIDSLAATLNGLTDGEKLALRVAVAAATSDDAEVVGFGRDETSASKIGLVFQEVDWVWKAPAGTESVVRDGGKGLLDYDWIA